MRTLPALGCVALLLCGCTSFKETQATHIVHRGETAQLVHAGMTEVPVALEKSVVHDLTRALESRNDAAVRTLVDGGRAVLVQSGTKVRVLHESYNERELRIESGAHAGKTGWVPYEWLRPVT